MDIYCFIAAATLVAGSWIHVPGGIWNPASMAVAEARAKLEPYVEAQAATQGRKLKPWASYTFQFQGREMAFKLPTHVVSKRRVIFVNAFCSHVPSYAISEFVAVQDGGTCYFRAYFDTVQHKYIAVIFNGVA